MYLIYHDNFLLQSGSPAVVKSTIHVRAVKRKNKVHAPSAGCEPHRSELGIFQNSTSLECSPGSGERAYIHVHCERASLNLMSVVILIIYAFP